MKNLQVMAQFEFEEKDESRNILLNHPPQRHTFSPVANNVSFTCQ